MKSNEIEPINFNARFVELTSECRVRLDDFIGFEPLRLYGNLGSVAALVGLLGTISSLFLSTSTNYIGSYQSLMLFFMSVPLMIGGMFLSGNAGTARHSLPSAAEFLAAKKAHISALEHRVEEFNAGLASLTSGADLLEKTNPERYAVLVQSFVQNRAELQYEVDGFIADFEAATRDELALVQFRHDCRRLKDMESNLCRPFDASPRYQDTQDMTAYIAVIELRRALEEKCADLCLPADELPPPPSLLPRPLKKAAAA